jgi:hypothetical protein
MRIGRGDPAAAPFEDGFSAARDKAGIFTALMI